MKSIRTYTQLLFVRVAVLAILISTSAALGAVPATARAASINATGVLGQPVYTSNSANGAAPSAQGFNNPNGVALDRTNHRLFVVDSSNNRVVVYNLNSDNTLPTGNPSATYVLGQPDFTSNAAATTQSGLSNPRGLAYDSGDQLLFVLDRGNNRVVVFNVAPGTIVTGENAINVIGQSDYVSITNTLDQSHIVSPRNTPVYDSAHERLFVPDGGGNRVLVWNVNGASTTNALLGRAASAVIGESSFTSSTGGTTQTTMKNPIGLGYDPTGMRLFVGDGTNKRITVYDVNPANLASTGQPAIHVLGASNFTTAGSGVAAANTLLTGDGMAYDSVSNRLFVPDEGFSRVMVFDVGTITDGENASYVLGAPALTSGGSGVSQSLTDGPHTADYNPDTKQLFVGDYSNNRVLVFNVATSTIQTGEAAAGALGQNDANGAVDYNINNINNKAINSYGFSNPQGVAVDTTNHRAFVSDSGTNRVLVYSLNANNTIATSTASYVLGQADFAGSAANRGGSTAISTLSSPSGLAYDSANNRLFVADTSNNRVLVFNVAIGILANGENAAHVLGQANFTAAATTVSSSTLSGPVGLAYDSANNRLFVSDTGHSRIVSFSVSSISDGENASSVLGQASLTSSGSANRGSTVAANSLSSPKGLAYDATSSTLYVADTSNNRVVAYSVGSITNGESASHVLGQSLFTTSSGATTQAGLWAPTGLAYDSANHVLYVGENTNSRVSAFDVSSITDGENAIAAIGQSNFVLRTQSTTQNSMRSPTATAYDTADHQLLAVDTGNNRLLQFTPISISTASIPNATYNKAYSQTVATANAVGTSQTFSISSGSLPSGLSLNSSTGVISGTSTALGTTTISVKVADNFSDGSTLIDHASFTFAVATTTPTVTVSAAASTTASATTLTGSITDTGGDNATSEGFEFGTTNAYGTIVASSTGSYSIGSFTKALSNLTCGTTYHFASFAHNSVGTTTSADTTFTTSDCPLVATVAASAGSILAGYTATNPPPTSNTKPTGSSSPQQSSQSTGSGGLSVTQIQTILGVLSSFGVAQEMLDRVSAALHGQVSTTQAVSMRLSRSLYLGRTGADVTSLQRFLIAHGYLASGNDTGYFGPLTTTAVERFQTDNDIAAPGTGGYGVVGPKTRGVIEGEG